MKLKYLILFLITVTFNVSAQSPKWEKFNFSNSSIPFEKIFCIEFDHQGKVWFGTNVTNSVGHVGNFDGNSFQVTSQNNWVYDLTCDSAGKIWLTNSSSELASWDGTKWTTISNPDLDWYSDPLYIDGNNNKWTNPALTSTLLKYNGTNWITYDPSNSKMPDNRINCITGTGSELYIGTNDSGLVYFNGTSWETYNSSNSLIPDGRIYSSCRDHTDTLWFLVRGGFLIGIKGNSWVLYQNNQLNDFTNQIAADSKGNIWIAQSNKVFKYDKINCTEFNSTNSILPQFGINTIAVDKNDKVWIGTRYGLFSFQENFDSTIEIITQPISFSITEGDTALFLINAKGSNMLYQWQKNRLNIDNATTSTFRINSVKTTDAGNYRCIVKNQWDSVVSNEVSLNVSIHSSVLKELLQTDLHLFPNPTDGIINLLFDSPVMEINISISDLKGVNVFNEIRIGKTDFITLDLQKSGIKKGCYLLNISTSKSSFSKRIIFN